jgi:hypothetical protein
MIITAFNISDNKTQLNLTITDAATVTSLKLWTDKTFKNFNKAIDLNGKLTGSATENITITLANLGIPFFDGIYFIEAEDPNEISLDYAYNLERYKECILDKIMYMENCNDCLKKNNINLINAHSLLVGLNIALEDRYIDEILNLVNALNVYCSNDCSTCGKYKNVETSDSETIFGSSSVFVEIDGGDLD